MTRTYEEPQETTLQSAYRSSIGDLVVTVGTVGIILALILLPNIR